MTGKAYLLTSLKALVAFHVQYGCNPNCKIKGECNLYVFEKSLQTRSMMICWNLMLSAMLSMPL